MVLDSHRKIDMYMCYDCGYIEGRKLETAPKTRVTNYERLNSLNLNELVAFVSSGLGVDEKKLANWMDSARA